MHLWALLLAMIGTTQRSSCDASGRAVTTPNGEATEAKQRRSNGEATAEATGREGSNRTPMLCGKQPDT
jgi:hypothetical protein